MTDNSGTGTPALPTGEPPLAQTVIVIRDFQPGQVYRVVFITPDQVKQLPAIPDGALQIAIAPAGVNS